MTEGDKSLNINKYKKRNESSSFVFVKKIWVTLLETKHSFMYSFKGHLFQLLFRLKAYRSTLSGLYRIWNYWCFP